MNRPLRRRAFVAGSLAAAGTLLLGAWTRSRVLPFGSSVAELKPGDYTWAPERAPEGAIVVLVSIPEQRAYVYRHGILVSVATCSTGRPGHSTPTGVFTILQKDKDHVSSTYKGAKMPYMERLTWSGIALHAGNLPGYPASHGCIRLPYEFAQRLFGLTHLGAVVILADQHSEPANVVHPGLLLPQHAEAEAEAVVTKVGAKKLPPQRRHEAPHRPAKVVISVADKSITLFEDGHVRAKGVVAVRDPGRPVGNHVFVLKAADAKGHALVWTATSYLSGEPRSAMPQAEASIIDRITTDRKTAEAMHALMHPGLVMVITDAAAPDSSRSHRSFVIATHHEPEGWQTEVFPR